MAEEFTEILPQLFRTEFRKIVSVLSKLFGLEHIETAEDIVSDTFLQAAETWGKKGNPDNPTAWLYTVAKNKTKDYLKRNEIFSNKIITDLQKNSLEIFDLEIDLSNKNIEDSQLKMLFAICHPSIPKESQIGLSLRILLGLGIEEIAEAFMTGKETINKRLLRAKDKLREEKIKMEFPPKSELENRLEAVLKTLYLLFNEGYYSASKNTVLRKDLCLEAMQLTYLLTESETTNKPFTNALLALMCFHASRFEARIDSGGEIVLYDDQDTSLWDLGLIQKGEFYLNQSAKGKALSKYHLEAAIAYYHTQLDESKVKWNNILQLYNKLLQIEYSPLAALNRTFALSKAENNEIALKEALKLNLENNHLYNSLLGELYQENNYKKALKYFEIAFSQAKTLQDQNLIRKKISMIEVNYQTKNL
jgi:RNA polymerase sigma factor (sigma-70 family)